MSPWRWRLGRLAWARLHYQAIGEWRRLWWRFWWRVGPQPTKRLAPPPPPPPQPKGPMHWVADATGRPLCGASLRERWTVDYEVVDCEQCIADGRWLQLEYWVSNR